MNLQKKEKKERKRKEPGFFPLFLLTVKVTALLAFTLMLKWTQSYTSESTTTFVFSDFKLAMNLCYRNSTAQWKMIMLVKKIS